MTKNVEMLAAAAAQGTKQCSLQFGVFPYALEEATVEEAAAFVILWLHAQVTNHIRSAPRPSEDKVKRRAATIPGSASAAVLTHKVVVVLSAANGTCWDRSRRRRWRRRRRLRAIRTCPTRWRAAA